jgi:DNA-binding HxlR family transcriptional regulator
MKCKKEQKIHDNDLCMIPELPTWAHAMLTHKGVGTTFKCSELSRDQALTIVLVAKLVELVKQGNITVTYDPKVDTEPKFALTIKGEKLKNKAEE